MVSHRRSTILPRQKAASCFLLHSIWGSSSQSSSSSSEDDDDTSETGPAKEVGGIPTDEVVIDTSLSSTIETTDDAIKASTDSTEKSLLALVNDIGNNFQVMAKKSTAKGSECKDQYQKILFAAKACVYYTLFIFYRAYRGFFVLLPATFRQVYRNMEGAMNAGNLSLEEIGFDESGVDTTSNTPKWRTKITVSILTSVVTVSYVIGGVLKMTSKFIRTIAQTSDVPKSFGAAADEVMNFEGRISRVGKVNGDEDAKPSGLAP